MHQYPTPVASGASGYFADFQNERNAPRNNTHETAISQELEFELPVEGEWGRGAVNGDEEQESPDDDVSSLPVLRVNLSNGGEMALRARDVKVSHGDSFGLIWYNILVSRLCYTLNYDASV